MRVAEHAASEGDVPRALAALATATKRDPVCIPARALQLDLLADDDPSTFATQLEAIAEHLPTDEGRSRALLLAAWVWGARANDSRAARLALTQASVAGAPDETVARIARTLASLAGDGVWYEEATKRLLAGTPSDDERPMLWLELARARFARGALEEARAALHEIGATPKGAWLGRALEAFLPRRAGEDGDDERLRKAAERERCSVAAGAGRARGAPCSPRTSRAVSCSWPRCARTGAGDVEGARRRLRELASQRPDDVLVETYLAELERSRGALDVVALVAERCAGATDDAELAASLRIEAGLTRWRQGIAREPSQRSKRAIDGAPEAARAELAWAMRGIDSDSLDARRRAMARALDGGGDEATILLERFATELAAGDATEASGRAGHRGGGERAGSGPRCGARAGSVERLGGRRARS